MQSSIHTFSVEAIEGGVIDFADFKGKKLMVVNGASECGFTPQYQQLEELYEQFKDQLVIVVFPANNFGGQEPGSNEAIHSFCTKRYGVTFPLAAKIDIRTHPVYQWLTRKAENGVQDSEVTWNFQKYLLDEEGRFVQVLSSSTSPFSDEILQWLDVLA